MMYLNLQPIKYERTKHSKKNKKINPNQPEVT